MQLKVNGIQEDYALHLGVQTTPDNLTHAIHQQVKSWHPKKAKSYTISNFRHTDYHHNPVSTATGYADFMVQYFSAATEGKTKL